MRKRGYYVNNTLLRASGQVNGWTSEQVNSKERQSKKGTSGQVTCGEYETTWELSFRYAAKSITSHKGQRLSDLGPYHVFSLVFQVRRYDKTW